MLLRHSPFSERPMGSADARVGLQQSLRGLGALLAHGTTESAFLTLAEYATLTAVGVALLKEVLP